MSKSLNYRYFDLNRYISDLFFPFSWVNTEKSEEYLRMSTNYQVIKMKRKFQKTFIDNEFLFTDVLSLFIKSLKYKTSQMVPGKKRISYRLKDTQHGFYFEYVDTNYLY